MKTLFLILILLLPVSTALCQEYEYGKPEEMNGLTKIFIDTKGDLKDRDRIIEEIEKSGVALKVVDLKSDAELFIDFNTSVSKQAVGRTITNTYDPRFSVNVVSEQKVKIGEGKVTIRGKSSDNPRVVMNFDGGKRNPASAFVKEFIKAYQKANKMK